MGSYGGGGALPSGSTIGDNLVIGSSAANDAATINSPDPSTLMRFQIASSSKILVSGTDVTIQPNLSANGNAQFNGVGLGFYVSTPAAKATITGSRAANAALASLLNALNVMGLITDSTSA